MVLQVKQAEAMTQELSEYKVLSYDDLFTRYENNKILLKDLAASFQGSFEQLKSVISEHQNDTNAPFISALSSVLEQTRESIGALLSDPGTFKPTRLERQISEFQSEKSKGLELVKSLQLSIESLKEEKRNWLLQKQKGQKLIEEYERQLKAIQNGQTIDDIKPIESGNQSMTDRNVSCLYSLIHPTTGH